MQRSNSPRKTISALLAIFLYLCSVEDSSASAVQTFCTLQHKLYLNTLKTLLIVATAIGSTVLICKIGWYLS